MISFPNCKINIGLNIVSKRSDGYHDIETVFYPLALCDALEVLPAGINCSKDEFSVEGIKLEGDPEQNLCMKALRLMQKEISLPFLKIVLMKKIPVGAGLGGGSSDAAFTLKMLNSFKGAGLSDEHLIKMTSVLGSDCAFFIANKPVFAIEKGDKMSSISLHLEGLTIVIVKPPIFVSTAYAYSVISPTKPAHSLRELIQLPVAEWRDVVKNDFEDPIFSHYPEIAAIKKRMYEMGALYASMSGSGSSVFGIFNGSVNAPADFPGCFYHEEKATSTI